MNMFVERTVIYSIADALLAKWMTGQYVLIKSPGLIKMRNRLLFFEGDINFANLAEPKSVPPDYKYAQIPIDELW